MCLAVPVCIEEIKADVATCRVGDSSTFLKTSLMLLDGQVEVGDWLIVHAGFALRKLDPTEAQETLKILRDMVTLVEGGTVDDDPAGYGVADRSEE